MSEQSGAEDIGYLLVWLESRYHIRSNGESGKGRFDISLTPKDPTQKGMIIEIKSPWWSECFPLSWFFDEV